MESGKSLLEVSRPCIKFHDIELGEELKTRIEEELPQKENRSYEVQQVPQAKKFEFEEKKTKLPHQRVSWLMRYIWSFVVQEEGDQLAAKSSVSLALDLRFLYQAKGFLLLLAEAKN